VSNIQVAGRLAASFDERRFLTEKHDGVSVIKNPRFRAVFIRLSSDDDETKSSQKIIALVFKTSGYVLVGSRSSDKCGPAIARLYRMVKGYLVGEGTEEERDGEEFLPEVLRSSEGTAELRALLLP